MKLLFDQNLAPRLVGLLADLYPNSAHVTAIGLGNSPTDKEIWSYAHANDYVIVTKDNDFEEIATLLGSPPKVVVIKRGNCPTKDIEIMLRFYYEKIEILGKEAKLDLLTLS